MNIVKVNQIGIVNTLWNQTEYFSVPNHSEEYNYILSLVKLNKILKYAFIFLCTF